MFKNFIGHFKTVIIHKWWVFYYCVQEGLVWRGLKHDLSKFSFTEFIESVKYFQGNRSPIDACKEKNGYSMAWQHHKGRNRHHYEYWQDEFDKGTKHLIMPFKDTVEMFCDYLGAGRAYMKNNFSLKSEAEWWKKNRDKKIAMHQIQKDFLDMAFEYCEKYNELPKIDRLREYYDLIRLNYKYVSYLTDEIKRD